MREAMMPCPAFEDRLLEYSELSTAEQDAVDRHAAACQDCREYLATLEHIDLSLTTILAAAKPTPDFAARVKARVPPTLERPKILPELLDFVGWSSIVTILSVVAVYGALYEAQYWATPTIPVLAAVATLFLAVAIGVSLRSHADLKE